MLCWLPKLPSVPSLSDEVAGGWTTSGDLARRGGGQWESSIGLRPTPPPPHYYSLTTNLKEKKIKEGRPIGAARHRSPPSGDLAGYWVASNEVAEGRELAARRPNGLPSFVLLIYIYIYTYMRILIFLNLQLFLCHVHIYLWVSCLIILPH